MSLFCARRSISAFEKGFEDGFKRNFAFADLGWPAFEVDPALIEAIDHVDAWSRVLHAHGFEEGSPGFTRNGLSGDGMAEQAGEGGCDLVGTNALGACKFHGSVACSFF